MGKRLEDEIADTREKAAHKQEDHVQRRKAGERKAMSVLQVGCCDVAKEENKGR
jgi:hypothetical protein